MKDSSKTWQVSTILCIACALLLPFNVAGLYIRFALGIEIYAYLIAIPAAIVSFLLAQIALAIALYRTTWTRAQSVFLSIWVINISIIAAQVYPKSHS